MKFKRCVFKFFGPPVAVGMFLWLTGCSCPSHHGGPIASSKDLLEGGKKVPPAFARGFTVWRWVGVKKEIGEPCPTVDGIEPIPDECCVSTYASQDKPDPDQDKRCTEGSGWKTCHMFGAFENSALALRAYCLYQHRGQDPDLKIIDKLIQTNKLADLGPDAMAVGGMATPNLTELSWKTYQSEFLHKAGQAKLQRPEKPKQRVRLAILDTAATRTATQHPENHPGRSRHGYTLVRMARELLCNLEGDPEQCLAQVSTRLALPYIAFDRETHKPIHKDTLEGGYFGTIGDLAQALREEIADWRKTDRTERLVLNLSVAWHPVFGGTESHPDRMPPNVKAVYEALEEASCGGILVIAAAGNRTYGPKPHTGPLMPAGWEQRFAPDARTCKMKYNLGSNTPSKDEHALIYAAGGIRAYTNPKKPALMLANALPDGVPGLLAYADHAVVESHIRDTPAAILTGSSVSALVVSATAAAVLGYRPSLSIQRLMQLIHSTSQPAMHKASFCLGGNPADPCPAGISADIVRFCKSLGQACSPGQEACPPDPIDCLPPSNPDPPPSFTADPAVTAAMSCSAATPCPQEMYPDAQTQPWVLSQPGSNPCPPCEIRAYYGMQLSLELAPDLAGPLSHPTLVVDGRHYSIDLPSASPGTTAVVSLEDIPILPESQVTLSFILAGSNSVSSPVYIHP